LGTHHIFGIGEAEHFKVDVWIDTDEHQRMFELLVFNNYYYYYFCFTAFFPELPR